MTSTRVLSISPALTASTEDGNNAQVLLGPSPAIAKLWSQLRLLAPHFRIALLAGETGCGAESVAHALHLLSAFADTRLIIVRPAEVERQLRNPGALLGNSTRGALFIPDIDRLTGAAQQVLLRLVRLRRNRRVALIASATRDLRPLVAAGSFSGELACLLGSLRILVPALRERAEDLPLLLSQCLHTEAAARGIPCPELDGSFMTAAAEFAWPGNLTQLRSAIAWLLDNASQRVLTAADLQTALAELDPIVGPEDVPIRMISLDHVVHEHVRAVLVGCNGNKLRAAEVLGISRSTLYRMLDTATSGGSSTLAFAG